MTELITDIDFKLTVDETGEILEHRGRDYVLNKFMFLLGIPFGNIWNKPTVGSGILLDYTFEPLNEGRRRQLKLEVERIVLEDSPAVIDNVYVEIDSKNRRYTIRVTFVDERGPFDTSFNVPSGL